MIRDPKRPSEVKITCPDCGSVRFYNAKSSGSLKSHMCKRCAQKARPTAPQAAKCATPEKHQPEPARVIDMDSGSDRVRTRKPKSDEAIRRMLRSGLGVDDIHVEADLSYLTIANVLARISRIRPEFEPHHAIARSRIAK